MIVILISTAWLATLSLVVAVCWMAAHGERVVLGKPGRSPNLLGPSSGARTIGLKLEDRRSKAAAAEHIGNRAQEDLYVRP